MGSSNMEMRNSELKERSTEITQSEEQRRKRWEKKNRALEILYSKSHWKPKRRGEYNWSRKKYFKKYQLKNLATRKFMNSIFELNYK
jgi:hypothetical protein